VVTRVGEDDENNVLDGGMEGPVQSMHSYYMQSVQSIHFHHMQSIMSICAVITCSLCRLILCSPCILIPCSPGLSVESHYMQSMSVHAESLLKSSVYFPEVDALTTT
jgi:hypothetical protein